MSNRFHLQLIFRVITLCISIAITTFLMLKLYYILAGVLIVFTGIQAYSLVYFLNTTNRKVAYFIKALINEDFTLKFNSTQNDTSLNALHLSLNQLNNKIQKVYMQNQTQEKYYQELLKQAEIGVLTINTKGHILFANPKAENLLNYKPLNHVKQFVRVSEELYQLLSKSNTFNRKLISLSNERETKQLALKSTEIILNREKVQLITLQDIRIELDTKETDSWIKLIRVLTHEIMNSVAPITSISDSLLKINEDLEAQSPTKKGLNVIKTQSDDLILFIQSYRNFLNIPQPDKKIINLASFLERIDFLFRKEMEEERITFRIKIEDNITTIFADEQQFLQVILNLIKNAIQSIEIEKKGEIDLLVFLENKKTIIKVIDNGKGISKEELSQIFVPFFTTKQQGTGIGLSLSKQIIQMHGGNLEAHSTPEKTTFSIYLT